MHIFKEISNIFFPNICLCCKTTLTSHEKIICTFCLHDLPLTDYTLANNKSVSKIFYGRVDINHATALLFYSKRGIVKNLIHNLKYSGHQEIGVFLGNWLGKEMQDSKLYDDIDFVIPVPLHKKRFIERGYNQLSKFGERLSTILKTSYVDDVLIRKTASKTQTQKNRIDRWFNVTEQFYLTDLSVFKNKHILLIDDVITTGATIEACANELLRTKNIKISIAVMAITI